MFEYLISPYLTPRRNTTPIRESSICENRRTKRPCKETGERDGRLPTRLATLHSIISKPGTVVVHCVALRRSRRLYDATKRKLIGLPLRCWLHFTALTFRCRLLHSKSPCDLILASTLPIGALRSLPVFTVD